MTHMPTLPRLPDERARHGVTQMSMETKPAPLRKVITGFVDENDLDRETLECGHTIMAPTDYTGHSRPATRRRCMWCRIEAQERSRGD